MDGDLGRLGEATPLQFWGECSQQDKQRPDPGVFGKGKGPSVAEERRVSEMKVERWQWLNNSPLSSGSCLQSSRDITPMSAWAQH